MSKYLFTSTRDAEAKIYIDEKQFNACSRPCPKSLLCFISSVLSIHIQNDSRNIKLNNLETSFMLYCTHQWIVRLHCSQSLGDEIISLQDSCCCHYLFRLIGARWRRLFTFSFFFFSFSPFFLFFCISLCQLDAGINICPQYGEKERNET